MNVDLDQEPYNLSKKNCLLTRQDKIKAGLQSLKVELVAQTDVLFDFEQDPPYLESFDRLVRKKAIERITHILQLNDEYDPVQSLVGGFDEKEVTRYTVKIIDKEILRNFIKRIMQRAHNKRIFQHPDMILDNLKIPEKMKAIMPLGGEKRIELYSLCVTWTLCVEKNTDLISRCISYDLVSSELIPEYKDKVIDAHCPSKSSAILRRSRIAQYCLSFAIDNMLAKAVNSLTASVRRAIIGICVYLVFGALSLSLFSTITNLVNIPYLDSLAPPKLLTSKLIDYATRLMIRITGVDLNEFAPFIIRESITVMESANDRIESIIDQLIDTQLTDAEFKTYHLVLEKEIKKLTFANYE